jgi:hypothetical protein
MAAQGLLLIFLFFSSSSSLDDNSNRIEFTCLFLLVTGGDSYEEALAALSSLITKRSRADKSNKGDRFELVFDYLKVSLFDWILVEF